MIGSEGFGKGMLTRGLQWAMPGRPGGGGGSAGGKSAAPAAQGYSGQSTFAPPKYIADSATQDAVSNTLANADMNADVRGLAKQGITPGRSAGKGDVFRAKMQSALAQAQGRNDAANIEMGDMTANSKMRTDYEYAREMEAQKLAQLQHAASQSEWATEMGARRDAMRRLAAQQNAKIGILGGMLDFYGDM